MLDKIMELIKAKDLCVLATVSRGVPHCSLMNYISNDDCTEIYMATQKNTLKYRNLMENSSVSLLVDTREEYPGSRRSEGKAITVSGTFQKIDDDETSAEVKQAFLERHPYIKELIEADDSEIIRIKISSFLFLEGFTDAYFEKV